MEKQLDKCEPCGFCTNLKSGCRNGDNTGSGADKKQRRNADTLGAGALTNEPQVGLRGGYTYTPTALRKEAEVWVPYQVGFLYSLG